MFDIGFSELVVIAVVALVVIGPERLPTVARTVGALLGRLNRYVSDVKADVEREMRLEEMKKLRAEVEAQAAGIERQVVGELEATRVAATQPVTEINQSLADVMHETGNANLATQPAQSVTAAVDVPTGSAPETTLGVVPGGVTVPQSSDATGTKA
jgi:sec-independent protein translocase protein TatB